MASGMYCTGPAHVYVAFISGLTLGNIFYVGTGAAPPHFKVRRGWKDIFNDLTGDQVPFDLLYLSQESLCAIDFNRFDMSVVRSIQSQPNVGGSFGINVPGDIGTMMIQEGGNIALILNYPYAAIKPAMKAAGLPNNIIFPCTVCYGPDDESQGTTEKHIQLVFRSLSGYNPLNGKTQLAYSAALNLPPIT